MLNGSPALSTTANAGSLVGGYPITVTLGTLSNANYTFTFTDGTLTVTSAPAPIILSIDLTNDPVLITWSSVAGETYRLQYIDSLNTTNWNDVAPDVTATGPTATQTNAAGGAQEQFYRVMISPP